MSFSLKTLAFTLVLSQCIQASSPYTIEMAERIDALVEKKLKTKGLTSNKIASEEQFLRRSSLGIIGRVPSVEETGDFLKNPESGKKNRLIDQLLDHPGYVSHQTNWMSDVLRAKSKQRNPLSTSGQVYIDWIKESFSKNLPYDKFVYTMLASKGDLWDETAENNGALGYYMRDYRMVQDNVSNTMQVFLGTRMACAQCHDHPFDKWTQKNFFELSAYMNGLNYNNKEKGKVVNTAMKMSGTDGKERENRNLKRTLSYSLTPGIHGDGNGHIRLPHDYQYKDGKPGEVIKAAVPFGEAETLSYENMRKSKKPEDQEKMLMKLKKSKGAFTPLYKDNNSREVFAKWLTSKDNPRFAKTLANRLWKRVMGMGLIEPVDDIREHTMASDPELLTLLESIVKDLDFNIKEVYRVLYYTDTYKRASQGQDVTYSTEMAWSGPLMKRLSAEQIWDSLMTLRSDKVDENHIPDTQGYFEMYSNLSSLDSKELSDKIVEAAEKTKKGKKVNYKTVFNSSSSMSMMASMAPKKQKTKLDLNAELGPKPKDKEKVKAWFAKRNKLKEQYVREMSLKKVDSDKNYFRASELSMPARSGHFLFQLGQSTKESIEGANDEANVPQVLTLMNGLEAIIYGNDYSGIRKELLKADTPEEKIDILFEGTLTRKASDEEMTQMLALVEESPKTAYQDILWVLVNTHEFKFIQ